MKNIKILYLTIFITVINMTSAFAIGTYFEFSNTVTNVSFFGNSATQTGDSVNLCVFDNNSNDECLNETTASIYSQGNYPTGGGDNRSDIFIERSLVPKVGILKLGFGGSIDLFKKGRRTNDGLFVFRFGGHLGLSKLSGKTNNTRIDGTGLVYGIDFQFQENNFELFELYPPLGFRPILKKSFYRSEIFPVHIVGLNINGLKHFYRANGMLNGESFSYGLSYKVNLKKKQRYYLDLMKEEIKAKIKIDSKSFEIKNNTVAIGLRFETGF